MSGNPKVSIIVTTCGRWELLDQAIKSIKKQDFDDYEVLLMNDGVNNQLKAGFADEYMAKHGIGEPKWKWVDCTTPATKRVSASINMGMDLAKGELITQLCDDDLWLPGRLSRLVKVMDAGAAWAIEHCLWLTAEGLLLEQEYAGHYQYKEPFEEGHEELTQFLINNYGSNFIVHDCVMYRPTDLRWPTDIEHHTPVDWRFYCALWRQCREKDLKVVASRDVGAVAYYPGTWRSGMDMGNALKARDVAAIDGLGVVETSENKIPTYARNDTSKIRKITKAGNFVRVLPGALVRVDKIARFDDLGNVRLPPGFSFCVEGVHPALDDKPEGICEF